MFSSVQSLSRVQLFATPWITALQASQSITNSRSPPKPMSIESVMPPTISSSVVPFSSCTQSFPASESFQMSQFFASGTQSIWVSASTSVLPMNTQDWSPLGWTVWSPWSPRDSQEASPTPQLEGINSLMLCLLYNLAITIICGHWESQSFGYKDLSQQSNVSAFQHTVYRFVIAFLPRSNHLLISWPQSPFTVIWKPKKRKSVTTSTFSPSICHELMGLNAMILVFLIFSLKSALSLSSFTLIKAL